MAWKAECHANRALWPQPAVPDGDGSRGFSLQGTDPETVASGVDLAIVITTFQRPEACFRLLRQLHAALIEGDRFERCFLCLYLDVATTDESAASYAPVLKLAGQLFERRYAFWTARQPYGKHRFYLVHRHALHALRSMRVKHALYLQDDVELVPNFIARTIATWNAIDDARKAVLYLCATSDDELDGRWIRFRRRGVQGPAVFKTQWFDLAAFFVGPRFFDVVGDALFASPPARWRKDPSRSSGVGEQLTRRLFGRANVYQVCETFVWHGGEASRMNQAARQVRVFDNRNARPVSASEPCRRDERCGS